MVNFENDIDQCLFVLKKGGLILYPTDTIWGIGCDATNANAVEKIYQLKQRPDEKAMIILVADEKNILKYVASPDVELFNHLKHTQKPTTVIYDGALGFPDNLVNKDGTIAIRICRKDFCRQLIKRFRKPVVSTSANISGQPFPHNFSEISDEIKDGVDYIVQYGQEDKTIAEPSALIKWRNGKPLVIRP